MRSLTIRDTIWSFLKLDNLLVCEVTSVVEELHRVLLLARFTWTFSGLVDSTAVDIDIGAVSTDVASEECFLHVGNDGSSTDDQTLDANQLVHVGWVELTHVDRAIQVEWTCGKVERFNFPNQIRDIGVGCYPVRGKNGVAPTAAGLSSTLALRSQDIHFLKSQVHHHVPQTLIHQGDDLCWVCAKLVPQLASGWVCPKIFSIQVIGSNTEFAHIVELLDTFTSLCCFSHDPGLILCRAISPKAVFRSEVV